MPEIDDDEEKEATAIQTKPVSKSKAKSPPRDEEDDADVKPRSKKKRADEDEDDDDDDAGGRSRRKGRADEDDDEEENRRSIKKKKAKKKSGVSMLLIAGVVLLGGGALLSCGLCAVGAFVWPGFLMNKKADLEAFVPSDANLVMGGNIKLLKSKLADFEKLFMPPQVGVKREDIEMNSEQVLMFGNTRDNQINMTTVFLSTSADISKLKLNPHLGQAQTIGGHSNVYKIGPEGRANGIDFDFIAFVSGNVVVAANGDQQSFIATLDRGKKPAQPNAALKLSRGVDKAPFWIAIAADAKTREELKKAMQPNAMQPNGLIALPAAIGNATGAVDGVEGLTITIDVGANQELKIDAAVPCKNAEDAGKIRAAAEQFWNIVTLGLNVMAQGGGVPGQQVPQSFIRDLGAIQFATQGSSATAKLTLSNQTMQELALLGQQQGGGFMGPGPAMFRRPARPIGPGPGPIQKKRK